ncbi:hypothetical protein PVK06_006721 [Gossypium arboreum]|uniref:Uncharacterized protein n=1 Tax=Gossypium arboreum TaxID=29729 RepID=A0ABR0QG18_GOSAR|nr:hypothetical protein PVK06_006721 [Gossypium arboreum]
MKTLRPRQLMACTYLVDHPRREKLAGDLSVCLLVKHHKYEFGILERSHHLREMFDLNSTSGKLRYYLEEEGVSGSPLRIDADAQARPYGKIAMDSVARKDTSSSSSYDDMDTFASRNKKKRLTDSDTSHDKGKSLAVG